MKNGFIKIALFSVISIGSYWCASAQVYVQIRPVAPVVVQVERPSPAHVWIGEEWVEEGHGYRYVGGHWAAPPHGGDKWNQGHWNHGAHGDNWVRGGWGHGGGERRKR